MQTAADINLPPNFVFHPKSPHCKSLIRHYWKKVFGRRCIFCERKMRFKLNKDKAASHDATIDHINARGLGGTNDLKNLQVICNSCNASKSKIESLVLAEKY